MSEVRGLVSISIPFFNRQLYLAEAVESVIAQTYPHWELFLVDDGSTDDGTQIARRYAERYPGRIRYLEHPGHSNRGVNCTRNLGAKQSRGEYLAFLDSDDVILPHKFEHQVAVMETYPDAGLIFGPSEYWYSWQSSAIPESKDKLEPVAPPGRLYLPPFLLTRSHPIGSYGAPCPSSFLIRRSAFDLVGGFDEVFNPQTFQLYEDSAFLAKIYLNVPVYITDRCSDRYRCHSQSAWHLAKGTAQDERARGFYFRWLRQYLRNHGFNDPSQLHVIRRRAWMYWLSLPAAATKRIRRFGERLAGR